MGVISDSCILSIYILHLLKVFTAHIEGYAGVTANVSRSKNPNSKYMTVVLLWKYCEYWKNWNWNRFMKMYYKYIHKYEHITYELNWNLNQSLYRILSNERSDIVINTETRYFYIHHFTLTSIKCNNNVTVENIFPKAVSRKNWRNN